MELNKEQQQAIESQDRFIFLLAGAGSGKTRTVIEKIKSLLKKEVKPKDILAITFTKKAAEEMRKRLNNDKVNINTFHGFCYEKLEEKGYQVSIIDPFDCPFSKYEILEISNYKNSLSKKKSPASYYKYEKHLQNIGKIDFDDLLIMFLKYNKKLDLNYKYIFIDEFQDTNELQYKILQKLIHKNSYVFAVGDPDQSIYRFRGANYKIIDRYIKDYNAKVFNLTYNYRSKPEIINRSNHLISKNRNRIKKSLIPKSKEKGLVKELNHLTYKKEAEDIILKINEFLKQGIPLDEIAILYRNHNRSLILKRKFLEHYLSINNPNINFMSCHEAKGLEFEIVFIIGLEAGLFPSNEENRISELEEERRLMFVAMTRAKSKLYLSYVEKNEYNISQKKSLFLKEIFL